MDTNSAYKIAWILLVLGIILLLISFVLPQAMILAIIFIGIWVIVAIYWIVKKLGEMNPSRIGAIGIILIIVGLILFFLSPLFQPLSWISGVFIILGILLILYAGIKKIRTGESREYNIGLSALGVIAIILILIGIIINVVCTFLLPECIGWGNYFFVLGFAIGVIGLFLYVIKQKAFK